ncbi:MAG: glycosyltransferase [Chloroflexi bacterium]|nr:glycosyltransferase [Chloroflexota bacterium]
MSDGLRDRSSASTRTPTPTDSELPLVSCLCPTYARPRVLRETIWCFLQQDYANAELIVVNDHPAPVFLDRTYPNIRVYNLPRFASLGAVRNHTVALARGDYLLLWDDDDLYLPWRIRASIAQLVSAPERWYFKPRRTEWSAAWLSVDNTDYRIEANVFHSQLAMRREGFDAVGGYDLSLSVGEDFDFEDRTPAERWIHAPTRVDELMYVYRWGNGINHISALGEDQPGKPRAWRVQEARNRGAGGGRIVPGFDRDYWKDLVQAARQLAGIDQVEVERLAERLRPYHANKETPA